MKADKPKVVMLIEIIPLKMWLFLDLIIMILISISLTLTTLIFCLLNFPQVSLNQLTVSQFLSSHKFTKAL